MLYQSPRLANKFEFTYPTTSYVAGGGASASASSTFTCLTSFTISRAAWKLFPFDVAFDVELVDIELAVALVVEEAANGEHGPIIGLRLDPPISTELPKLEREGQLLQCDEKITGWLDQNRKSLKKCFYVDDKAD